MDEKQSQSQDEERKNPEDDSIFEKTTWIPGGPVISKPPRPDDEDQQENDSQGHG